MATSYTDILRLALPATGELDGTWGNVVNDNITKMLEEAITGRAEITTWASNEHILTEANGITSESRCLFLDLGGTLTATGSVVAPTGFKKFYIVRNTTTGGFAVEVGLPTGNTVSVPNGRTALVYADGTDVSLVTGTMALQDASAVAITGGSITGITDLAVADGGTGASDAAGAKVNLEIITALTGAAVIPAGTEAQRDGAPQTGYFRFNTDTVRFEGFIGSSWAKVGVGATGGGNDEVFIENDQTVTTNYTITAGKNALTTGPIEIDGGVVVTVPSGSRWVIL